MADPSKFLSGIPKPTAAEEAALRAMLKPQRITYTDRSMSRNVVLTENDERAFGRLLREAFPTFLVIGERTIAGEDRWWCGAEFHEFRGTRYGCVPEAGWSLESCIEADGRETFRWPTINFWYVTGHLWQWPDNGGAFPSAMWRHGTVVGAYASHNTDHLRFLRKVWRLMEKITTNKVKLVHRDTGAVRSPCGTGMRCGFDALRWCAEDPLRVLDQRYRPTDDWTMPASPYYD